mgnify:CR=1 FL=1
MKVLIIYSTLIEKQGVKLEYNFMGHPVQEA